ncbi:3-oxoacyl-ACP synthase [Planosporangium thailandense]|uniref:3-oxoacyl-ACP synthase n=1 Tax=Planosporangium thailandense TaxID=765197 RepID=A0ABX0XXM5_9ACTN|nr:beta-ketoacyl synthase N-terminal-like domain-containing protein [Planosporangium thailandense]NJC70672.1 3-oxoacyl-ACP synthase [Planosporangium thailandense]
MSWSITGTGAVASVGANVNEIFDNLCAGLSGRRPLQVFDRSRYTSPFAYEMDDRGEESGDVPGRATRWLLAAVEQAAREADLGDDLSGVPVIVGSGLREHRSMELWHRTGVPFDGERLHFGAALQDRFGVTEAYCVANACAASLYALALGADLLAEGGAPAVIVAGVDMVTESMFGLVERMNPVPPQEVRPFDRQRRGAVMGEAAVAVVLRPADSPYQGRARATLRGVGVNCDAFHVTAPSAEGIAAAIRQAHEQAGIKPESVDLVMLHGTGTLLNDAAEASAMQEVFGAHVSTPVMTAIKSMTGHTSGASGLLGLIVAARALAEGRIPPTLGLTEPIDEVAGFRFPFGQSLHRQVDVAQVNAFGFGGVNAVAIVEAVR